MLYGKDRRVVSLISAEQIRWRPVHQIDWTILAVHLGFMEGYTVMGPTKMLCW